MNRYLCAVTASLLSFSAIANWHNQAFSDFSASNKGIFISQQNLTKGKYSSYFYDGEKCYQPSEKIKLNTALSLVQCDAQYSDYFRLYRKGMYQATIDTTAHPPILHLAVQPIIKQVNISKVCPTWDGGAKEINVSQVFADGDRVRDAYSGQEAIVTLGKINLIPSSKSNGLLLLEKVEKSNAKAKFDWKNAIVYFVMTDRFYNGDPSNDHSYGRHSDGMQEIGTFHGGDLKGLTEKLDYLQRLGVNAIWITSPLEQMHGWVGGGNKGDFPHYAYHGYYHLDWTKVDANMGSEVDLKNFIDSAHKKGIRVLFDIVMNHTGYATLADMQEFQFGSLYLKPDEVKNILGEKWTDWKPKPGQNWHSFNDFINFNDAKAWSKWWGHEWVRSDIAGYDSPKLDDYRMSLASLPDIKTESNKVSGLPVFYQNKPDTDAKELAGGIPRQYLITWLSDWVKKYGVDGFRVDTAKHVELTTWNELKHSSASAFKTWQESHINQFNSQQPFWMVGEAWGHGVNKSAYFTNGFDAMLNFDFQPAAKKAIDCFADIEQTYQQMDKNMEGINMLSYLSSHDTELFFATGAKYDLNKQKTAADLLLLAPGAVQIFYGDESGRRLGPSGSDPMQGTRSDMNWKDLNSSNTSELLTHWQKLANFRNHHDAIGDGVHNDLSTKQYYAFSRTTANDKVMVVWLGNK